MALRHHKGILSHTRTCGEGHNDRLILLNFDHRLALATGGGRPDERDLGRQTGQE